MHVSLDDLFHVSFLSTACVRPWDDHLNNKKINKRTESGWHTTYFSCEDN
jgi:hypothetical protein